MASPVDDQPPSLQPFWIGAAVLVVVDGFVFNQGLLAVFVGLWAMFSLLVSKLHKPDHPRYAMQRGLILLGAALLVVVCNFGNNRLAMARAGDIIGGVVQFQAKHGRYPASLQELTPEFLPSIPGAKIILFFNAFEYSLRGEEAYLAYKNFPPMGTSTYLFSEKRWVP
ncbi:MAG: hypothetical protein G8345_20280 [Magnetococcales bacterium]|nr:hypothetical protein [Magnetococcales bacterium]